VATAISFSDAKYKEGKLSYGIIPTSVLAFDTWGEAGKKYGEAVKIVVCECHACLAMGMAAFVCSLAFGNNKYHQVPFHVQCEDHSNPTAYKLIVEGEEGEEEKTVDCTWWDREMSNR
jgi:hypothetical protein